MTKKGDVPFFNKLIEDRNRKIIKKGKTKIVALNKKVEKKMQRLRTKAAKLQKKVQAARTLSKQRQEIKELKRTLSELRGTREAKQKLRLAGKKTLAMAKTTAKGTGKALKVAGKTGVELILGLNRLADALEPPKRKKRQKRRKQKRRR